MVMTYPNNRQVEAARLLRFAIELSEAGNPAGALLAVDHARNLLRDWVLETLHNPPPATTNKKHKGKHNGHSKI